MKVLPRFFTSLFAVTLFWHAPAQAFHKESASAPDYEIRLIFHTHGMSTFYGGMLLTCLVTIAFWHGAVLLWRRKMFNPSRALTTYVAAMRMMIDSAPQPIVIRDVEGRLVACNARYLSLRSVDLHKDLGKKIIDMQVMSPSIARQYHEAYLRVMRNRLPEIGGGTLVAGYGDETAVFHWIFPCFDLSGCVIGVIAGWIDVSERQKLLDQLKASQHEAEEASNAKTKFLATMSHEIRTPLNAVLGMLEIASKRAEQGIIDRVSLDVASRAAHGLVDLLGDTLDIVRIESGRLTLAPERVNLHDLAQSVVRIFGGVAQQKLLQLRVEFDPSTDCDVFADALRLKQILSNLLSNAIKFTSRGEVCLSLHCVVSAEGTEVDLTLSVADTGVGISENDQIRLFSPFTQVGNHADPLRTGSGLGLTITQALCEMMGGRLSLISSLGVGTCIEISLRLPLLETIEVSTSDKIVQVARAKRLNILIVDDYPANRLLLSQQLNYLGHDAIDSEDGALGLRAWRQGAFDVVITDGHMPVMNGYDLARAIRDEEQRMGSARCVIVGLTANAQPEEKQRCIDAGMDDCLFKPVSLRVLNSQLSGIEPLARTIDATAAVEGGGLDIDLTTLHQLARGDQDSVSVIISDLAKSLEDDMQLLRRYYSATDLKGLAELAHRIKGGGRIVGAQNVLISCVKLETACIEADTAELLIAVEGLHLAMSSLRLALVELV
ncbi:ATP-binding protein [Pseudomonas lactis]|uniref:histidine kinase n=1 Tax=Pseudomonas lactis TaxID=1615674 RepID=I4KDW4_9PSED|nr:ATP-binding protein [Pseudomonas lactis]EIK62904.1 sensory box histidine kinase/response regulator [Pseudomonas lactis]